MGFPPNRSASTWGKPDTQLIYVKKKWPEQCATNAIHTGFPRNQFTYHVPNLSSCRCNKGQTASSAAKHFSTYLLYVGCLSNYLCTKVIVATSLFRKRRFALNFLFQQNASKFAIFHVQKNPCSQFFFVSFRATLPY